MEESTDGFLLNATLDSDEDRRAARALIATIEEFQGQVQDSIDSIAGAKAEVAPLADISRDLKRAVPRLSRALNSVSEALVLGKSYGVRVISVLQDRLDE
jgi:hypothetical protein